VVAHVTIVGEEGGLQDWSKIIAAVADNKDVIGAAPYIHAEGMLTQGSAVSGTVIRGILPADEGKVSQLGTKMLKGSLDNLHAGEYGIVIGSELAYALGVDIGDKVTLTVPQASVTPVGILPRLKRFTVVGIFEVGMYEYDSAFALVHLEDAQRLLHMENSVTGVRLKLADLFSAPRLARQLQADFAGQYLVSDWTRQHSNFFRAVQMEKTVMFVILLLIVAVAAFNIVSTLVMMVTDKHSDIAILRTLGMSPGSVMVIFMVQGCIIGVIGTLLGTIGGVILALNVETVVPAIEHVFGIKFLAADVYYITELPSDMRWSDVFRISSIAFILTVIATIYPAWRGARTQPAEALRYE
jgi:lipoprotein-releasing system permease protein